MAVIKDPVYSNLNMRLKIGPADRNMFFFALFAGCAVALACDTWTGGACVFGILFALACAAGSQDPQLVRFWAAAMRQKSHYDPAK